MSGAVRELVRRGLHALRRSTLWWALGIVALALVTVASWPSLEGTETLDSFEDMGAVLEAFGADDLATPAGYLDGQLFALMLPLLLSGLAVTGITALTSGDEDAGRLELLHALPLSRPAIWLARAGASLLALLAVNAGTIAVVVATRPLFSLEEVGVGRLAVGTGACALLAAFHAAVAYAAGGAGASRGRAAGIAVLVLVAGYVLSFLLPLADGWAGARHWSPWYWALGGRPVSDGPHALPALGLAALTAGLVAAGTFAVTRRDLRSA
jgi:ABC-2 type transport system permease protein